MGDLNSKLIYPLALACMMTAVGINDAGGASGKIICWKDKSGKVVGCGDTVPPEYQQGASKELDKHGITRKTIESAEETARRRAHDEEATRLKAESDQRAAAERRRDGALLATYANEQEIDAKRDRDLQAIELLMNQLRVSLKNAAEREKDAQTRKDAADKSKKGSSDALKQEAARAAEEVRQIEHTIAAKEKEKEAIRARYADYRRRFAELKAGAQPTATPSAGRR